MPTRTAKRPAAAARPATKPAPVKPAAGPRQAAEPAAAAPAAGSRAEKPAKTKLVRDSFTIPAAEHALIAQLKQRAVLLERPAKKSEVLRAALKALATMDDSALLASLAAVPAIKTGRPKEKKDKAAKMAKGA
jgi:hypothetical protein